MQQQQPVFKDIHAQNFIELRFSQKNTKELSTDEALYKYKRNAYILGRIFSFTPEDSKKDEPSNKKSEFENQVTVESVKGFQEKYELLKENHEQKLQNFTEKQKLFKQLLQKCQHLQTEEQVLSMIEDLKNAGYFAEDHPFFNEISGFHLNTDTNTRLQEVFCMDEEKNNLFSEKEEPPVLASI